MGLLIEVKVLDGVDSMAHGRASLEVWYPKGELGNFRELGNFHQGSPSHLSRSSILHDNACREMQSITREDLIAERKAVIGDIPLPF